MRTLAIDLGTRRVGLALSDAAAKLATPHSVLQIKTPAQAIEKILKVIAQEQVERIVIGLPLNMDGSPGPAAQSTKKFGQDLAARANKPIIYVDDA